MKEKLGLSFGIFIFMIIILSHETISSSLSSLVSTVVSDSKGGLSVGSAPSAIICFLQNKLGKTNKQSKKLFWVDKQYKLCTMQWRQARCTLRWTLDRLCNARRYFPGEECRGFRRQQVDKQYTIVSYIFAEQCGQQHRVLLVLHRTRWTTQHYQCYFY